MAGLPAAVRAGLLRTVRPLVALAQGVPGVGIVLFGVAGCAGAGVVGPP
ncbi:hypothetical protein ABT187_40660 [Streptomyces sp. NPDC001817]